MKTLPLPLLLAAGSLLTLSGHAGSLILGSPTFVGDFESVTFVDLGETFPRFTASQAGDGWLARAQWELADNGGNTVAFRKDLNRFAPFPLGIVFDGSALANEDVILSFEMASQSSTDNNGGPGFLVIGTNYGNLTNNNVYGVSNVNNLSVAVQNALDGVNAAILYDGSQNGSAPLPLISGPTLVQVGFNMGTWNNYLFVFSMNAGAAVPTVSTSYIDNVSIVIPEPSTYAALFGLLALGTALLRRRRK